MTKTLSAKCAKCGSQCDLTAHTLINVGQEPELRDKVRDGSLFVYGCPVCGAANIARYATLYHDPAQRLMVWLLPEGAQDYEASVSAMQSMSGQIRESPAMDGYVLRRVPDVGSLIEKVTLHDAGLDDAVMELCKWVTRKEMNLPEAALKFYRMEGADNELTLAYPKDGQMLGVKIGFNVYEDCRGILSRNPAMKPKPGFTVVDAAWIDSLMA